MSKKISEIYGARVGSNGHNFKALIEAQICPFLSKKCLKNRKSEPEKTIGTCTVVHKNIQTIICPHRLLQNRQIFTDSIHLLTSHQPGNQFHIVPEVTIPGGSVDYFLASVNRRKVEDFVGIELQTLDSTGTIWPSRQRLAMKHSVEGANDGAAVLSKAFGMNWKMTAKTILVQLHHKIKTFENVNKHLVLVIQDCLLEYMREAFDFSAFRDVRLGDPMHIHSYLLEAQREDSYTLQLAERISTNATGIETCLGLQASPNVEIEEIVRSLESKISDETLVML